MKNIPPPAPLTAASPRISGRVSVIHPGEPGWEPLTPEARAWAIANGIPFSTTSKSTATQPTGLARVVRALKQKAR